MKFHKRDIWLQSYPKDLGASCCVFCDEKEQEDYILWKSVHWKIMYNKYPYLGLKNHTMLIPVKHIKTSDEITLEMYSELPMAYSFMKEFYSAGQYFSLTRESFGGRSLEHLHTHFLPGVVHGHDIEYFLEKQGFTNQLDSE